MKQCRNLSILAALGLFASAAVSQAATLNITGCDSLTVVDGNTIQCSAAPPVTGAPSGCTVTPPSVALPAGGGDVSEPTVSCSSAFTGPAWSRNQSTVKFPVNLPANTTSTPAVYTYSGSVCSSADPAACSTVTYTATVAAGVAPPPTTASCGNLKVITAHLDTDATNKTMTFTGQRYVTEGFAGTGTIAVAQIDVPADIKGGTTLAVFEYAGNQTTRKAYLSRTMCDTSATSKPYLIRSTGPVFNVQVNGTPTTSAVNMQAGETWYLMVKNEQLLSTASSCTSGACDIGIKLYRP
jgi:hypothetical protein